MSTVSASDNLSSSLSNDDQRSLDSAGVEHGRVGLAASVSRAESPVGRTSEATSKAAPSIEVDELPLRDEFQLPREGGRTGYQGVLWHAFHGPGNIGTEAGIIDEDFARLLAQELAPYYKTDLSPSHKTKAEALARDLQSWVELGELRRMFYRWIDKSRMNQISNMYQVVKKCEKKTRDLGRELLEGYEFLMHGDRPIDDAKTIARLRTNLFLDLSIGEEFDFFVDGQRVVKEHDRPAKLRLEWWVRINDQSANFRVRGAVQTNPKEKRWLTVNITGEIISTLASQGIFFHGKGRSI
jgi:hypothetical protein